LAGSTKSNQKAPQRGAFLLLWLALSTGQADVTSERCQSHTGTESERVTYVFDGDTLKLADGRKVRLIGINTPELGRDGDRDEPGAVQARQRLMAIVQDSHNRVFLLKGAQPTDRYGRQLAHLYAENGSNIAAVLLREGLGYAITFPPNLANLTCYQAAEAQARRARRGLWHARAVPLEAETLTGQETGFVLLQGSIGRIGKSRSALWLNLVKGPALRIEWRDWQAFSVSDPESLAGKRLEVRGWLYRRKGQQRMQVRHPSAIRWLN